jgi:TRAP-type C4-dicarboxylate transport system permease small subunit
MFSKALNRVDRILSFFEDWTLFIAVITALIALFFNVVLRYGFNYSLAWSEELVREVIIYTTFIGCSVAVKGRSLIKVDATVQLLPRLKAPLTFFSNFCVLIFAGFMIYYGWLMAVLQVESHQKTIILEIPLVYLYAVLPLMGILMIFRIIQVFHQDIREVMKMRTRTP